MRYNNRHQNKYGEASSQTTNDKREQREEEQKEELYDVAAYYSDE